MPNSTIPIEPNTIPEVYEAVRFGFPKEGELYLSAENGLGVLESYQDRKTDPRLILRKRETRRYLEFTWEVGNDPVCTTRKIIVCEDDVSAMSTSHVGGVVSDLDPPNYYNVFLVWGERGHPMLELDSINDQIPFKLQKFILGYIVKNFPLP